MQGSWVAGGTYKTFTHLALTIKHLSHLNTKQNQAAWNFFKSRSDSHVTYSCHYNSSLLLSPYLYIRGVSLSSIHYTQSRRVYINQRHQHIRLIWS